MASYAGHCGEPANIKMHILVSKKVHLNTKLAFLSKVEKNLAKLEQ